LGKIVVNCCRGREGRYSAHDACEVSLHEPRISRSLSSQRGLISKSDRENKKNDDKNQSSPGFLSFERWLNTDGGDIANLESVSVSSEVREVDSPLRSFAVPSRRSSPGMQSLSGTGIRSPQPTVTKTKRKMSDVTFYKDTVNKSFGILRNPDPVVLKKRSVVDDADYDEDRNGSDRERELDSTSPLVESHSNPTQDASIALDAHSEPTDDGLEAYLVWLDNHTEGIGDSQNEVSRVSFENSEGKSVQSTPPRHNRGSIHSTPRNSPLPVPPEESPVPNIRHPREQATTPYQPLSPFGRSPGGSRSRSRNSLWKLMAKE
jgi:hypothetical protein